MGQLDEDGKVHGTSCAMCQHCSSPPHTVTVEDAYLLPPVSTPLPNAPCTLEELTAGSPLVALAAAQTALGALVGRASPKTGQLLCLRYGYAAVVRGLEVLCAARLLSATKRKLDSPQPAQHLLDALFVVRA